MPKDRHKRLPGLSKPGDLVPVGAGITVAASAIVAALRLEHSRRRVKKAYVSEADFWIETLKDVRDDKACLVALDASLRSEWGGSALLGFDDISVYSAVAGETTFVASRMVGGKRVPIGALQTMLARTDGQPQCLVEQFPTFEALVTSAGQSRRSGSDTAVLLQITVFEATTRGAGVGSLLRDAALQLMPPEVKYALTTTPVDLKPGAPELDLDSAGTFTSAMRFHLRGGAQPTLLLPGYKSAGFASSPHSQNVAVMRYVRAKDGSWSSTDHEIHVEYTGPLRAALLRRAAQIQRLPTAFTKLLHRLKPRSRELEQSANVIAATQGWPVQVENAT